MEDFGNRRDEGSAFAGWGRTQWRELGSEGRPPWEVFSGGEGRGSKALRCRVCQSHFKLSFFTPKVTAVYSTHGSGWGEIKINAGQKGSNSEITP